MLAQPQLVLDDIADTIYTYLSSRFPSLQGLGPDVSLLDGAVDSLGFLELMMFLSERFGISLDDDSFDFREMVTPASLVSFVKRMTS